MKNKHLILEALEYLNDGYRLIVYVNLQGGGITCSVLEKENEEQIQVSEATMMALALFGFTKQYKRRKYTRMISVAGKEFLEANRC